MYTANKRQKKHRILFRFFLIVVPILLLVFWGIWFLLFKNSDSSSTNFSKVGSQIAVVRPATEDFKTDLYKVTLPSGWAALGRKNPFANEVYYEYQSKTKDYENRWLRVYIDVFPRNFPLNKLMPISVVENKIIPGVLSDDCTSFTGAPLRGSNGASQSNNWTARWQGVDFVCDMAKSQNYAGTASQEEGNETTLVGSNGSKHQYFFVYIDHNVRPEYQIFTNALKSFETL